MSGIAFLFSIIAIVWLALWSVRDPQVRSRYWAPFDMREPEQERPAVPGRQHAKKQR